MTMLARSVKLEVQKVFGSSTLIVLLLSPVISAFIVFWMFDADPGLVTMFLLFNVYIITVVATSLSIVEEKERGTLSAMAVTPLDLKTLLWTKAGVSIVFALVTSLLIAAAAGFIGLPVGADDLLAVSAIMLMSAVLYAAVAVAIATYTGGVKQVEQVGTGVLLGLLLLLMLPLDRLPEAVAMAWIWLPVLNARILLYLQFQAEAQVPWWLTWGSIAVNTLVGVGLLAFTIYQFKQHELR